MDPYELKIGGAHLTVRPREDGTYEVFRGDTRLAHLYPDVTNEGIIWETADWIDDEYATTIGMAIEEHEKHNAYGPF
jgi:hypothetical protein